MRMAGRYGVAGYGRQECLTRGSHGFTLLELLVALAMVAILAEALYVSLYVGFKARETGTRSMEPVRKMANTFTLLAQDFDGALPPTATSVLAGEFVGTSSSGTSSGSNSGFSLSGGSAGGTGMKANSGLSASNLNSDTGGLHAPSADPAAVVLLSFYTSSNSPLDGETGGDVRKVELSLETPEGDSHPAVVRRIYGNLMPSKQPEPRIQVLARDVRIFSFRYYDGSLWRDDWDSKLEGDILPMAVEVTLNIMVPATKTSDEGQYQMTRVFAIPCGVNAAQAAADAAAASSSSGSGTGGGGGSGTGGGGGGGKAP